MKRIGRWHLLERLGPTAFSNTWAVSDGEGERGVLKVLNGPAAPGALARLRQVCHGGVVGVLDSGDAPVHYVVTELAPGQTMAALLAGGGLEAAAATGLAAALCDAVAAAHSAGVVHGDIKPAHVVVESAAPPRLALVDFSLDVAMGAGALEYAAPERLGGAEPSQPADVFALGLVIWELLHGAPPWAELELSEALMMRRQRSPTPQQGPDWLRAQLAAMLAVSPASRPPAARVAALFRARGHHQLALDAAQLLRRATRTHVLQPEVEAETERWLEAGGVLAFSGPSGAGKSRALERAAARAGAAGRPVLRLVAGALPWESVERALASPVLRGGERPLALEPDDLLRGELAASEIAERAPRGLVVVADAYEELDIGARATLSALRRRLPVCVAGAAAPPWAPRAVSLPPLDDAGLAALYAGVRREEPTPELLARLRASSEGLPGAVVQQLTGELALPRDAAALATLLALARSPLPVPAAVALAGLSEEGGRAALASLELGRIARVEQDLVWCPGEADRKRFAALCPNPADVHRRLTDWLLEDQAPDLARVGLHLVGSRDAERAGTLGPAVLEAARGKHLTSAVDLADRLWELAPAEPLVVPRAELLIACGRAAEARTFLESWQPEVLEPHHLPLAEALGRVYTELGDGRAAMALVRKLERGPRSQWSEGLCSELEAWAHLRAGRFREAALSAAAIAEGLPPEPPDELARWLRARLLLGRARTRTHSLSAAVQILASVPREVGRGTRERALLDLEQGNLLLSVNRAREAGAALCETAAAGAGLRPSERARTLLRAGSALYDSGERSRALGCWEEAQLLFEQLGAGLEAIRVRLRLCEGWREAGRWERSLQAGREALAASERLGQLRYQVRSTFALIDLHIARSDFDAAAALAEEAERKVDLARLREERVELLRRQAELAVHRRSVDALGRARAAHRIAHVESAPVAGATAAVLVAVCEARAGLRPDLDTVIAEALHPLRQAGATRALYEARLWAGEAHVADGRVDEARAIANQVLHYAEEVWDVPLRSRAERLLSLAESARPGAAPDRLSTLLDLAGRIARAQDAGAVLGAVAEAALELLEVQRAFVLLLDGEVLTVAAARVRQGLSTEPPSMSVVGRALSTGRSVLAPDLDEREDLRIASQSLRDFHLRSVMCAPLIEGESQIGALYVDSRLALGQEPGDAIQLLQALAAHAAVAVTNARMARQARERAERAKDVAHDMRRPAASIATIASALLTRTDDDESRRALQDIRALCQDVLATAEDHLEERAATTAPLDLHALSRRLVALLGYEGRSRGVLVELVAGEDAPVYGVAGDLNRALSNLLSNAIKHSPPGATVEISLAVEGAQARWGVRDRGPGIPEGLETRIFERGLQAPGQRGGYGLGLNIARRILREHGGEVRAFNHPDGGAVFEVTLPLSPLTEPSAL